MSSQDKHQQGEAFAKNVPKMVQTHYCLKMHDPAKMIGTFKSALRIGYKFE